MCRFLQDPVDPTSSKKNPVEKKIEKRQILKVARKKIEKTESKKRKNGNEKEKKKKEKKNGRKSEKQIRIR